MRRSVSSYYCTGVLVLIASLLLVAPAGAVEVGKKAPDFTLIGLGEKPVKLADLLGKGPVVIYTFIQAFSAT
jgi:hypothetical protein